MHIAASVPFPPFLAMASLFAKRPAVEGGGPGPAGSDPGPRVSASGYDRVGVELDGEETRWFSRSEFQGLPLTERVRILAGGGARFFRGTLEVSPMEAMRGMP